MLRLHEQLASEQVARLEKQDLVAQVNRLIAELLESGHANLEEVAERLGIKARQLRTRLADAGTNFNQLVADYRCKLAKRLLAGTDESIDEIVYLTGFSEPSTFYRAFKRWVGMTPIEYRKLKAEEDAAEAAAKLDGVSKVRVADNAVYAHQLAEPMGALLVELADGYTHVLASASTTGKNVLPRLAALKDVSQPIPVRPLWREKFLTSCRELRSLSRAGPAPTRPDITKPAS